MRAMRGDPPAGRDFFVGRDDELDVLRNLLTSLSAGTGGAVEKNVDFIWSMNDERCKWT